MALRSLRKAQSTAIDELCGRRELKRLRDEESSCFNKYQLMADGGGTPRYLLGNLLGKGGFSDVYRVRNPMGSGFRAHPARSHRLSE